VVSGFATVSLFSQSHYRMPMSRKIFASLLNPFSVVDNDIGATGRQQRQASERFPGIVRSSRLILYDELQFRNWEGKKLLLGLAASFSLPDLYLADLLNEHAQEDSSLPNFVFNLGLLADFSELSSFYPGHRFKYVQPPIAGLFNRSLVQWVATGSHARSQVLEYVGHRVSGNQLVADLRDLTPAFFGNED